jgi:hypothetical protein
MSDGTLQTLDVTMLDDVNNASGLIQLDSNAKIPACSGAAITGLSAVTKNASDPAIATNPSGGVGTVWQNTTSGEMFICTDATAGANVWTNIGEGTGNIVPYNFQGTVAGYTIFTSGIDQVSFTTDGNATDVGDLTVNRGSNGGNSSTTHAYWSGGYGPGSYTPNTADVIERMSFASKGLCVDVGNLVLHIRDQATSSNETHGWTHGGLRAVNDPSGVARGFNHIMRFQYAASSNATDVGDLLAINARPSGHSDPANSYGYCSAGSDYTGATKYNVIQRYAMSSSGNATDVGDLTISIYSRSGTSSTTHGYTAGCGGSAPFYNVIEKFAYGSSSNATDVGNLTGQFWGSMGVSSTTFGYSCGGGNGLAQSSNNIDKYSFSTDGNATDVGDISAAFAPCGSQGCQV